MSKKTFWIALVILVILALILANLIYILAPPR